MKANSPVFGHTEQRNGNDIANFTSAGILAGSFAGKAAAEIRQGGMREALRQKHRRRDFNSHGSGGPHA